MACPDLFRSIWTMQSPKKPSFLMPSAYPGDPHVCAEMRRPLIGHACSLPSGFMPRLLCGQGPLHIEDNSRGEVIFFFFASSS